MSVQNISRAGVIAAAKGALRGHAKARDMFRSYHPSRERQELAFKRERDLKARLKRARTATVGPKGRLPNPREGKIYYVSAVNRQTKKRVNGYVKATTKREAIAGAKRFFWPENEFKDYLALVSNVPQKKNPGLFTAATTRAAKPVRKIKRPGARRVIERNTNEGGEIIGVAPGGFVKVKWDNRERPTLIKRSEIKRFPYVRMNPGLIDLAGGVQALEYLAGKAGPERKRKRNAGSSDAYHWGFSVGRVEAINGDKKISPRATGLKGTELVDFTKGQIDGFRDGKVAVNEKRNPSVREMSTRFQGRASGSTEEYYFSNSAPRLDFSRGGKFVFIKLKGTTIRVGNSVVAIDPVTEKLWLGTKNQAGMFKRKAKQGERLDYGPIDEICYLTAKKHIGNGKLFEYHHRFGEEGGRKPTLEIDHEGMPILKGGDYTIEDRGIVN